MGKKEESQPPSLFDNLEFFASPETQQKEAKAKGEGGKKPKTEAEEAPKPFAEAAKKGLTGRGPMQELYDFNFRQYSAYVICSRAIPAVEDGLKPVQRRIMHSLWENDDEPVEVIRSGNATRVARKDLVVGDIVILNAGDEVPADIHLMESTMLSVDESTLTGEPLCPKSTTTMSKVICTRIHIQAVLSKTLCTA